VKKWTKKQRIQVALVAPEAREIHGATRRLLAPMDPEATVPAGHVVVALPRRALQRQLKPARWKPKERIFPMKNGGNFWISWQKPTKRSCEHNGVRRIFHYFLLFCLKPTQWMDGRQMFFFDHFRRNQVKAKTKGVFATNEAGKLTRLSSKWDTLENKSRSTSVAIFFRVNFLSMDCLKWTCTVFGTSAEGTKCG